MSIWKKITDALWGRRVESQRSARRDDLHAEAEQGRKELDRAFEGFKESSQQVQDSAQRSIEESQEAQQEMRELTARKEERRKDNDN